MISTADRLFDASDTLRTRVVRVEARHLALPSGIRPFPLPDGRLTPTDIPILLIRLTDADGVNGHSLLWGQQQEQISLMEAGLRYLADVVTQHALTEARRIADGLRTASTFFGERSLTAFGSSGLLMAIEDLACRRQEQCFSSILGRKHDQVRVYKTGLTLHASTDELVTEATDMYARGVRAMKMLVGKPTVEEDADRVQAVRQSLPDDASLMADALGRWTADTASQACQQLAEFGLLWLEDPLPHDDVVGYRRLAGESPVPIATGESLFTPGDFDELLEAGVRFIVGEPERVGGMCAWADIAESAHAAGATMLPHLYPHVSLQLLATLHQDQVWLEHVPWFDSLVEEQLSFSEGGLIAVGSAPGAGFTPCAGAVERLARATWHRLNDH